MNERLSAEELCELVTRVFVPGESDTAVAVLVDLPDGELPDTPDWSARRVMAADWAALLAGQRERLGLDTHLVLYRNARMNNADLPDTANLTMAGAPLPATADELPADGAVAFAEVLASHSIILAPTELSATAPLKLSAGEHGFRAATMPGFAASMIPALRLDYGEINRRCWLLKDLLDRAGAATVQFGVDGQHHDLTLDLRHRRAHASGGLFPDAGVAGNLPSGETYIVPYEGEKTAEASRSEGVLPVQFDDEGVLYEILNNRAVAVRGDGPAAIRERRRLEGEPAYGNMAELGLGVLADFGLEPSGDLLLDEKLGLHIAFGRSDHFGGQVGAADFTSPEAVVHIDRVFLPSTQPRVLVPAVDLQMDDGETLPLIRDHEYVIDWKATPRD